MKQFHNILFVSNGVGEDSDALQFAIKLANDNKATLDCLVLCPLFNNNLDEYTKLYETFLQENTDKAIKEAYSALSLKKKKTAVKIEVEWGATPDIRIVQRVLRKEYDLVIKAVEQNDSPRGFKALDMALLRKCPCTVYLHRPFKNRDSLNFAVAIDPKDKEESDHELALNLLKLSHSLATEYNGNLSIISCWDFILEHYLKTSVFVDISSHELDGMILQESNSDYNALHNLVNEAGIKAQPTIYHQRGNPTELIPAIIHEKKIDVLVMGTVARTGISGFIIGNTAENILQKIDCSLWALKPQGFVSPVKAY
ncbi:universal stress protein [uncultured Legionella sp.]|uniref:universal stress protein n=1 Tax=uncultured Legionella sp. TaxID=210934 RepID=UPI0026138D4E|nr:universal stress protein [uncultured Legionella sp.]